MLAAAVAAVVSPVGGRAVTAQATPGTPLTPGTGGSDRYDPGLTGSVPTSVPAKLREVISVFDYMSAAQVAEVKAGTLGIDVRMAIQAAIAAVGNAATLLLPRGDYLVSNSLTFTTHVAFDHGAMIHLTAGQLTFATVGAGPWQIFSSALTTPVKFGRAASGVYARGAGGTAETIWAEWFGAKGDGVQADNSIAFMQWLRAGSPGFRLKAAGGRYNLTDEIAWPGGAIEMDLDFGDAEIRWTGTMDATKAMFLLNANNIHHTQIRRLYLNADRKAGYAILAKSAGSIFAIKDCHFEDCEFGFATAANIRWGDQSTSGIDLDGACVTFNKCRWVGATGTINMVCDGDDLVNLSWRDCFFNSADRNADWPDRHIKFLKGTGWKLDNVFFQHLGPNGWCIEHQYGTLVMDDIDTEEVNVLRSTVGTAAPKKSIVINGLTISDATGFDGDYVMHVEGARLTLRGCYLGAGAKKVTLRADSTLIADDVWLGGYLASVTGGSAAKGGDFLLANPQRCSINGRKPTDFRPINGNHRMTLWRGSASGDLPFGVKASVSGTATIKRDATAAYLEGGRYCAKVTVTAGALSGAITDGLLVRAPLQHSRPSRIVAYVSGWAQSMSAGGGPKIGILQYHWNGSTWASAASRIRVADVDANGHFFGIVHLAPSGMAGITNLGYVDVYVGLGVGGATGTLYVNEIGVLNADGEIWTASSEYPDFAQIKAISGHSSDYCYNGAFASGDGWALGTGWSIAGGKATHRTGGAPTAILSQDLGIVAQDAKATIGVTVSGRTAGSVEVKLAGVTVATLNANATTQTNAYTAAAGTLLEFVPTGDFDGSINDVGLYVAKGDGDAFNGDAWARAGVSIGGDQGILTTSATLSLLPNRIEWDTAAPTVGDWKVGDVVFNIAPATGASAFWQCSASGTPGTWKNGPQTP